MQSEAGTGPFKSNSHARSASSAQAELDTLARLYGLAGRICQMADIQYVIEIGGTFGAHLVNHLKGAVFLGLLPLNRQHPAVPQAPLVRIVAVDFNEMVELDDAILATSLIIWPSMDQDLEASPRMAKTMMAWLNKAAFALLSHTQALRHNEPGTHHGHLARQKSAFDALLARVGASSFLTGKSRERAEIASPSAWVAVGGKHADYAPRLKKSVLAIVSCYNDADFLGDVVRHLMEQGVEMHFVDNWSDDGTWELLQHFHKTLPEHVVAIERFPDAAKDEQYDWTGILRRKEQIAASSRFDWFIHYDSDELRTSCWPGVSLVDGISFIDSLGYNAINHVVIDFRPTQDGFSAQDDAKIFFRHFEENQVRANGLQIKAWKKQPGEVKLAVGGHAADFAGRRIYPLCFLLAHYSLRSTRQARQKIYKERLPRVVKEHQSHNFHGHYHKYNDSTWQMSDYIWDASKLLEFNPDTFHAEYLIKRLSGE